MRHPRIRNLVLPFVVATLVLVTGCSSDDDGGTDSSDAATTTEATAAGEPSEEAMAFCEDLLEVDRAITAANEGSGTPDDALAALDAVEASVPAELADAAEVAVEFGRSSVEDPEAAGVPSTEFNEAYVSMLDYAESECGFQAVDATLQEYSFGGLPAELEAGPTVVRIENTGDEYHEMILFRVDDEATETLEELLALPEEEVGEKVTTVAGAFAPIGETGGASVELEPGRYVAICFLPVGATQEAFDEMMSGGAEPEGAPHFTEGMVQEFTVA